MIIVMNANMNAMTGANNDQPRPLRIDLSDIQKFVKPKIEHPIIPAQVAPLLIPPKNDKNKDIVSEVENDYGEIIPNESDANAYVKDVEKKIVNPEQHQLVFKISPKMKLPELQSIAEKLGILVNKECARGRMRPKLKKELLDEISAALKH